jgi:outer membrane protein assembly factor BamB
MRSPILAPRSAIHAVVVSFCITAWAVGSLHATETENQVLRILPAPGKVVVDGKFDDWDLSGGIFACGDVERLREHYGVWLHAMYNTENVYLLARWLDPTPLDNPQSSKGGQGWDGDCLQVRFITGYKTPHEVVTWLTCWRDRDGIGVIQRESPDTINCNRPCVRLPKLGNALEHGAQQAFTVNADGKGYVQELAIPWKQLVADGKAPAPGSELRITVEPNFTTDAAGRLTIKDLFRAGAIADRVFSFRAYDVWGEGILEKTGHVKPAALRLADERELPVTVVGGVPVVDWRSLITVRQWPGFKTLRFDMPFDGHVSLNLRNKEGVVVRQLLTDHPFTRGSHEVKWDGLPTPYFRTPGEPLPAGDYTWEAIAHPGLKLTLRGWAATAGIPWEAGPGTSWGGDHGAPSACTADAEKVYLGWAEAESGKGVVAVDLAGKVVWTIGRGTGGAVDGLAVTGGTLFGIGRGGTPIHGHDVFRLRTSDGVFENWQGHDSASLAVPDLWKGRPEAATLPLHADGIEVFHDTLYLTFGSPSFSAEDVRSWKDFGAKLFEGGLVGDRLLGRLDEQQRKRLVDFVTGRIDEERAMQGVRYQRFDFALLAGLNDLLTSADLVPNPPTLSAAERALATRRFLDKYFGPALVRRRSDLVAVCDARSGKLRKLIGVSMPQAIHAVSDRLLYVLSAGTTVLALNPQTGKTWPVVTNLDNAVGLAVDAAGRIYVGTGEPDHQVKVFTAEGQPAGTIGRKGGRPLLGPWRADGLYAISGLTIDRKNRLWATEADHYPKRVSVWDVATGRPLKELFGSTHYGASGGAVNPRDPNVLVGVDCEWRFDPKTQTHRCTGVFDRGLHGYAVFCTPANGRLYLAVNFEVEHNRHGIRIFERLGEGNYRLRSEVRPDYKAKTTTFWSDVNGDGKRDADETVTLPMVLVTHGSNCWSMNLNPRDFSIFPVVIDPLDPTKRTVYRLAPAGYTACGAPLWDIDGMKRLPYADGKDVNGILPSPDGRLLLVCGDRTCYRCYETATGRLLWSYPNPFFSVHGSHHAPAPEPGLTRGAYGLIGTFTCPNTGTVWAINANLGEWYLLTEKGYFLARIFEGDPMQLRWPARPKVGADMTHCPPGGGGEDFGGSVTQAKDGKVYLQTGHTALWNVELGNLDQVRVIGSGSVALAAKDQPLARAEFEKQSQQAVGIRACEVVHLTPTLTGNVPADFRSFRSLEYQKNADAAVRTALAWDDKRLYLGFDVGDNSPWVNGAKDPAQMYVSGDTVDFQLGADSKANAKRTEAVAGDFRISIGNCLGHPTAVLYRKISTEKKPRTFTSGVVQQYVMDYVAVLTKARIVVHLRPDKSGYVVEAAIPWKSLGFVPQSDVQYRGDVGVTHGTATGDRTRLRTYWSNQETGLVDDAVFELQMTPKNWGQIKFKP